MNRRWGSNEVGTVGESGAITVFVALLAVALFALAGLVLDGGRAVSAQQAAQDEADQAARSGAEALSVNALRTGTVRLDVQAAMANAVAYTVAAGHPGTAEVVGNAVEVTIHYRVPTDILGIVGIGTLPVSATARAVDVHGVTGEQ
jgi:Putative Flp pilus-assembly TadE/G-like